MTTEKDDWDEFLEVVGVRPLSSKLCEAVTEALERCDKPATISGRKLVPHIKEGARTRACTDSMAAYLLDRVPTRWYCQKCFAWLAKAYAKG